VPPQRSAAKQGLAMLEKAKEEALHKKMSRRTEKKERTKS